MEVGCGMLGVGVGCGVWDEGCGMLGVAGGCRGGIWDVGYRVWDVRVGFGMWSVWIWDVGCGVWDMGCGM